MFRVYFTLLYIKGHLYLNLNLRHWVATVFLLIETWNWWNHNHMISNKMRFVHLFLCPKNFFCYFCNRNCDSWGNVSKQSEWLSGIPGMVATRWVRAVRIAICISLTASAVLTLRTFSVRRISPCPSSADATDNLSCHPGWHSMSGCPPISS